MKKKSLFMTLRLAIIAVALFTGQFALAAVASFAPMPANMLLGLSSVDASAITQYATANMKPLISTLVNSMDISKDISVMTNVKNKADLPKLTVGKGLKPYTGTFASENNVLAYTNRQLVLGIGQRDLQIDPEDYRSTFLVQYSAPGSNAVNKEGQIPFRQYLNEQIMLKLGAEINDYTAYFGFDNSTATAYAGGSTYAANAYITYTQNGVLKYFKNISGSTTTAGQSPDTHPAKWDDVSAAAVVPGISSYLSAVTGANAVVTGAISSGSTGLTAATTLYKAISPAYRNTQMVLHVSFTDFDFIVQGVLDAYGKYTMADMDSLNGFYLPLTGKKCFVKPASWLGTSRRMILEPANAGDGFRGLNLHMGTDLLTDMNQIEVIRQHYKLDYAIKLGLGFQIADVNAVWINDQA